MPCNSLSHDLTSKSSPELVEKLCVTSSNSEQCDLNSSTSFLYFLTMARELRDLVYSDLITDGNLEILRVSQQLHDEAKDLLYRKGVFRMPLYIPASGSNDKFSRPSVPVAKNPIQNFNIIFGNLNSQVSGAKTELDLDFVRSCGTCQGSGDCHITLSFKSDFNMYTPPTEIVKLISTFSNFKLITLRVLIKEAYHPMDSRNTTQVEPCHLEAMQLLAASLSPSLGAPYWNLDTYPRSRFLIPVHTPSKWHPSPFPNAQHLVFHPRASRRSLEAEIGNQSPQKVW